MTKQQDCIYHWTYELNMYRNPTVLITVLKVLGISMGLVWLFTVLISIGDRRFWWDGFLSTTKGFALVMLGFIVLGAVSYYLYATWSLSRPFPCRRTGRFRSFRGDESVRGQAPHRTKNQTFPILN